MTSTAPRPLRRGDSAILIYVRYNGRGKPIYGSDEVCWVCALRGAPTSLPSVALKDLRFQCPIGASGCPGLTRGCAGLSSACRLHTGILHAFFVGGNAFRNLPVRSKKLDRLYWIEAAIIHPMMRLTHEGKVIGIIVATPVIEMSDRNTRRNLHAANDAAAHWIRGRRNATCLTLSSELRNRNQKCLHLQSLVNFFAVRRERLNPCVRIMPLPRPCVL